MTSAFLAIDVQNVWAEKSPLTTQSIKKAADLARPAMPVMWAYKDLMENTAPIQAKNLNPERDFNKVSRLIPFLTPSPEDWIIPKEDMSIFSNPHTEAFLKKRGIDTLLVGGFMAGQCVYYSVVDGIKKGFNILVFEDLTADSLDRYETNIEILFHKTGASISSISELKEENLQAPAQLNFNLQLT